MGMNFQIHRAAIHVARGFRHFQKADRDLAKDKVDPAVNQLGKGLDNFASALDNLANAEEDAYAKAAKEIDKGNQELAESIERFEAGDLDAADKHYDKALDRYDEVLDLLD